MAKAKLMVFAIISQTAWLVSEGAGRASAVTRPCEGPNPGRAGTRRRRAARAHPSRCREQRVAAGRRRGRDGGVGGGDVGVAGGEGADERHQHGDHERHDDHQGVGLLGRLRGGLVFVHGGFQSAPLRYKAHATSGMACTRGSAGRGDRGCGGAFPENMPADDHSGRGGATQRARPCTVRRRRVAILYARPCRQFDDCRFYGAVRERDTAWHLACSWTGRLRRQRCS